jgi:hypothetical protein
MYRLSRGALPRLRGRLSRVGLAPEARLRSAIGYWLFAKRSVAQPMPNARLIQQDIAVIHAATSTGRQPGTFRY